MLFGNRATTDWRSLLPRPSFMNSICGRRFPPWPSWPIRSISSRLLRTVQSADRFHVLCLQRDKIRLYEGNRDGLIELKPAGVPWTVTDALGEAVIVQRDTLTAAGKSGEPRPAPRPPEVPPGHPAKGDDAKLDAEHFFRAIDEAILTHVSQPSGLPLLVTALAPNGKAADVTLTSDAPKCAEEEPDVSATDGVLQLVHAKAIDWQAVLGTCREVQAKLGIKRLCPGDRSEILKVTALCQLGAISENELWDSCKAVEVQYGRPSPPKIARGGYWHRVLEKKLLARRVRFTALLSEIVVPAKLLATAAA